MNRIQKPCIIAILYLTGSQLLVGIPGQALAQAATDEIPEHAEARRFGSGWTCNPGYRQSNGTCAAMEIPENGYTTNSSYGLRRECNRGYRADGNECVAVTVPENANLDFSGNDRECDKFYRKRSDRCVAPVAK